MVEAILVSIGSMIAISLLYRLAPFQNPAEKEPRLTLLPKYKTEIDLHENLKDPVKLAEIFKSLGFKKTGEIDGRFIFARGNILAFSSANNRVKVGVSPGQNNAEITLEAAWLFAFDTGDCWRLMRELCTKLEQSAT